MARKVKNYSSYQSEFKRLTGSNPYEGKYKIEKDVADGMIARFDYGSPRAGDYGGAPVDEGRSILDRTIDGLSLFNYTGAGFVKGFFDNDAPDGGVTPWQGFVQGLKASNPFGDGFQQGETTYSDVLYHAGWKPESVMGKIAKGTVGFIGDVLLDPTTYLSGGLSAVVKGSGVVGKTAKNITKMAENVPYMRYDNVYKEATESGMSHVDADALAQTKMQEALDETKGIKHMTEDMAEDIIKHQLNSRNKSLPSDVLKEDARKFANKYNSLMGIREKDGVGKGVTFGVANLPFGEKLASKMGVLGKTVDLGDGNGLRKVADKIGTAHAYQALRRNIYGRKIGKMLSNNGELYDLAHKDPGALFDFVKATEITKGLEKDKLVEEKVIRDRAKNLLGLTDAQSASFIKILEDKSKWVPVKKMVSFFESQEFNGIKAELEEAKNKTNTDLDTLLDERKHIEMLRDLHAKGMTDAEDMRKALSKEHYDKLLDLDLKHVEDKGKLAEIGRILKEKKDQLDAEIAEKNQAKKDVLADLDKHYKEAQQEVEDHDKYFDMIKQHTEAREAVKIEKKKAERASRGIKSDETNAEPVATVKSPLQTEYDELTAKIREIKEDKLIQYTNSDGKIVHTSEKAQIRERLVEIRNEMGMKASGGGKGVHDAKHVEEDVETAHDVLLDSLQQKILELKQTRPGMEKREALSQALSEAIFGRKDVLRHNLKGSSLDKIMEQIKEGKNAWEIGKFIKDNPQIYSEHANQVYSRIAKTLGYDSWDEAYTIPMERLYKISQTRELDTFERQALGKLDKMKAQRDELFEKYYTNMSSDQYKKLISREADEALMKELEDMIDGNIEARRRGLIDDYSSTKWEYSKRGKKTGAKTEGRSGKMESLTALRGVMKTDEDAEMMEDIMYQLHLGLKQGEVVDYDSAHFKQIGNMAKVMKDNLRTVLKDVRYEDLTHKQKEALIDMTVNNIGKDGKLKKYFSEENIQKVKQWANDEAVKRSHIMRTSMKEREITRDTTVRFRYGNTHLTGKVVGSHHDGDGLVYSVIETKTGEKIGAHINDILMYHNKPKKIITDYEKHQMQYDGSSPKLDTTPIDKLLEERKALSNEQLRWKSEHGRNLNKLGKKLAEDKHNLLKTYQTDDAKLLKVVQDHDKAYNDALEAIRQSGDKETKLLKQLEDLDNVLVSDDALGTWLRVSSKSDLELLKDPDRYARVTIDPNLPTPGRIDFDNNDEILFDGKHRTADELMSLFSPNMLKLFEARGWTKADMEKALKNDPEQVKRLIIEHEYDHKANKANDMGITRYDANGKLRQDFVDMEMRAHVQSFEMLKVFRPDEWARTVDTSRFQLDPNLSISDVDRRTINELHDLFEYMGREEVNAGKLDKDAFESMLHRYVPHILTPKGERHFHDAKINRDKSPAITRDYGYGNEFNNHGIGRTIEGKSLEQINRDFASKLKGDNLFSMNVANIYLARALKHNELMYDDKYMKQMIDIFGDKVDPNGLPKGYKAVINMGMLKKSTNEMATMLSSLHMSTKITAHIQANLPMWRAQAGYGNKQEVSRLISESVKDYITTNFTKEYRKDLFDKKWNDVARQIGTPEKDVFAKVVKPMVELEHGQVAPMENYYNMVLNKYQRHLEKQMEGARKRGDMQRVGKLYEKLEATTKFDPFQIRQVNDAIVHKANTARELQMEKDKSRLLQMYDKFLHFMKLNQTTVMPSFHARNFLSNKFLNWLGVGADAVNLKLNKDMIKVAMSEGDIEKIGSMRPMNIDNPHPSLQGLVNNGQLHMVDLFELARIHGGIDLGTFGKDLSAHDASLGLFKKIPGKFDPTDTKNFKLYDVGSNIGNKIENADRLVHIASMLKQGHSIEEAVESSKKFLFDYGDLTAFEKTWMKRLIPYYTWLRKNGRLQVGEVIEQPGKYQMVAKVNNGIEHSNNPEDRMNDSYVSGFARDWIQTPFGSTNADGSREPLLLSPNMPFMDLARLPDPTRIKESIMGLASQLAPIPKAIIEGVTNTNMFFDSEIVKDGENPVLEGIKYAMAQFAIPNAVTGVVGADSVGDAFRSGTASLTGVKTTAYDYETSKQMSQEEVNAKEFEDDLGDKLANASGALFGRVSEKVAKGIGKGVVSLIGQEPKGAGDYDGALRPISKEAYSKLSDAEKAKYTAPTKKEAVAYNKKAEALAKAEYEKTGVLKRFTWTLLDKLQISNKEKSTIGYVDSVTDGDTFSVKIGDKTTNVRMLLVDTPETVHPTKGVMPGGKEASDYSKKMLFGKDVRLVFEGGETDTYGRTLAYVELDGQDYNKSLIEQGLGKTRYTEDWSRNKQKYSRTNEYFDAEKEASKSGKGIWQYDGYTKAGKDKDFNMSAVERYLAKLNKGE